MQGRASVSNGPRAWLTLRLSVVTRKTSVRKVSRIQAFLEASSVRGGVLLCYCVLPWLSARPRLRTQSETDLLEGLSDLSALHVSLEVLERSGVGSTVNALRRSEFASVATKARAMVKVRCREAPRVVFVLRCYVMLLTRDPRAWFTPTPIGVEGGGAHGVEAAQRSQSSGAAVRAPVFSPPSPRHSSTHP